MYIRCARKMLFKRLPANGLPLPMPLLLTGSHSFQAPVITTDSIMHCNAAFQRLEGDAITRHAAGLAGLPSAVLAGCPTAARASSTRPSPAASTTPAIMATCVTTSPAANVSCSCTLIPLPPWLACSVAATPLPAPSPATLQDKVMLGQPHVLEVIISPPVFSPSTKASSCCRSRACCHSSNLLDRLPFRTSAVLPSSDTCCPKHTRAS